LNRQDKADIQPDLLVHALDHPQNSLKILGVMVVAAAKFRVSVSKILLAKSRPC